MATFYEFATFAYDAPMRQVNEWVQWWNNWVQWWNDWWKWWNDWWQWLAV
jgi:hypothetical protein